MSSPVQLPSPLSLSCGWTTLREIQVSPLFRGFSLPPGKAFYDVGSAAPSSDVSCLPCCPVVQEAAKDVQRARKHVLPFIFV